MPRRLCYNGSIEAGIVSMHFGLVGAEGWSPLVCPQPRHLLLQVLRWATRPMAAPNNCSFHTVLFPPANRLVSHSHMNAVKQGKALSPGT
jgi:hypothetical protein